MKVVLTGASSFTGYWFAWALSAAGAEVVMPLRGGVDRYSGVRAKRVAGLSRFGQVRPGLPFGTPEFQAMMREVGADLLCHHAAEVGDYRSPDYDILAAARANTLGLRQVTEMLAASGAALVITGSVFEADEGQGETPLRAFSPYGVSKGISADIARYWCEVFGVRLGKFVIPNPFGVFEEPRFCNYLIQTWSRGACAKVNTPAYVRDNIHVDLLALAYAAFARSVVANGGGRLAPSGYVETQGAFAQRFAREVGARLGWKAELDLADQKMFDEPVVRINADRPDAAALRWSEAQAWDALAAYYETMLASAAADG